VVDALVERGLEVTAVDADAEALAGLSPGVATARLDVEDPACWPRLEELIREADTVLAATSYSGIARVAELVAEHNVRVARREAAGGGATDFAAPTESTEIDDHVRRLADESIRRGDAAVYTPQNGLSPGFTTLVVRTGIEGATPGDRLKRIRNVKMYVGALEQALDGEVQGALLHRATWSPESQAMEYREPVYIIEGGRLTQISPITPDHQEEVSFEVRGRGYVFEARYTAGGDGGTSRALAEDGDMIGSDTYMGYKSLRHRGSWDRIEKFFIDSVRKFGYRASTIEEVTAVLRNGDLLNRHGQAIRRIDPDSEDEREQAELARRRTCLAAHEAEFTELMADAENDDMIAIHIEIEGARSQGGLVRRTYSDILEPRTVFGRRHTAIEWTTAAGILASLELMDAGKLKPGHNSQYAMDPRDYFATAAGREFGSLSEIRSRFRETILPPG
jgi:saccharopine dehydrogenase-like NADP-dependent oxidoreductase